ncbi:sensor histidine kinase [Gallaecimonas xiamenensis]|uniref:histidine kinase n=1 Tax=Gallaecimonas xiamenensis 3-C-1 TaxID=745411 RepID=K2IS16_9GAMM|nr:HAMP domain-containing sensor histidine kinase [Gallaecimonas xiamenensis]EKE73051.1 sensor histidine kinase [Gallaecimonas xiamenensis 3-C-1]
MKRLGLDWLTGFAGRLFLWFWLVLTLMLVANVQLSRHLRSDEELRPPMPPELEELAELRGHLQRFADRPLLALKRSKVNRFLVLFDPHSLQPLERRRPRHWRIPELVASDSGVQVLEQGEMRAMGPFEIATLDGPVLAVWLMPPRPMSAWERFWQGPAWVRLAVSFLLVLALSLGLAAWLARPVRQLSKAARQLGDGDLGVRVKAGSGELGQLGQDFNTMAGKLASLLASQRRLLADVSHELRSPLTRLKLAAALMADEVQQHKYVQRIEKECDTLEHLIEQVLTLSRLEATLYQEEAEDGDMAAQVASSVQDWRFHSPDKDILLQAPAEAPCRFRPRLLQRVLDNLLSNACRYGQRVEVQLARSGQGWRLVVEDDGPGVPDDMLDKLFEPFYRGDPARGHQGKTGLGLAIAQAAAKAQGGTLKVGRSALGGLRFELQLAPA